MHQQIHIHESIYFYHSRNFPAYFKVAKARKTELS